jgi:hypothetical protein
LWERKRETGLLDSYGYDEYETNVSAANGATLIVANVATSLDVEAADLATEDFKNICMVMERAVRIGTDVLWIKRKKDRRSKGNLVWQLKLKHSGMTEGDIVMGLFAQQHAHIVELNQYLGSESGDPRVKLAITAVTNSLLLVTRNPWVAMF